MFEMMKSTPRGASINEETAPVDRSTSSFRVPTSSPLLQSSRHQTSSTSPVGDLSPLKDSDVYNDDAMM